MESLVQNVMKAASYSSACFHTGYKTGFFFAKLGRNRRTLDSSIAVFLMNYAINKLK